MKKISAIIITKNEENKIRSCLSSLSFVDDIIIVDAFSEDRTVEFAKRFNNVKVIQNEWLGFSPSKKLALSFTKHQWVLWLDADEELSEDLQKEIQQALSSNFLDNKSAYSFPRMTFFQGKWMKYCGWYPAPVTRLFDKTKVDFNDRILHEGLDVKESQTGKLQSALYHRSFDSLEDYFSKMNFYGKYGALELFNKKKRMFPARLILSPVWAFLKLYFLKKGFKAGTDGLIVSLGSAFMTFIKYTNYFYLNKELKRAEKRPALAHPENIVISRTDSIGDVILTLPIAGVLKHYFPQCKILFMGRKYTQDIIENCSHVDGFIDYDLIQNDLPKALKDSGADIFIHVFPRQKLAEFVNKAQIPIRIGTSHRLYHLNNCNVKVNLGRRHSDLHEAQLNLKLLKPFGIDKFFSKSEIESLYGLSSQKQLKTKISEYLIKDKFNLIMHPKSKGSALEWRLENFLQLSKLLPKENFNVIITGTKDEKSLIENELPDLLLQNTDATGKLSLQELITLIDHADGLVACSTGPLHIGAALGKYVCGLYPNNKPIDAGRWGPIGPKASYITNSGTVQTGFLDGISFESVAEVIKKWLYG